MRTRIGTDIIEIARIQKMFDRHGERFLNKIYTDIERQRLLKLKNPASYLSGRWAAKEAIFKLLCSDLPKTESSKIQWKDMSIGESQNGAPEVKLLGAAEKIANELELKDLSLSISHCKEYAIATVVAGSL